MTKEKMYPVTLPCVEKGNNLTSYDKSCQKEWVEN